jgi:hypothetical protein
MNSLQSALKSPLQTKRITEETLLLDFCTFCDTLESYLSNYKRVVEELLTSQNACSCFFLYAVGDTPIKRVNILVK